MIWNWPFKTHSVESFHISPLPPSSVKTGPDLAPAPGLLGQLLRWSGLSAGSMIHFLSQHHKLEQSWFTGRFVNLNDYSIWWVQRKYLVCMCISHRGSVRNDNKIQTRLTVWKCCHFSKTRTPYKKQKNDPTSFLPLFSISYCPTWHILLLVCCHEIWVWQIILR